MRKLLRHDASTWTALVLGLFLAWLVAAYAGVEPESSGLAEVDHPKGLDVTMWAATAALLGFVVAVFAGRRANAVIVVCYSITLFAGIAAVVLRSTG